MTENKDNIDPIMRAKPHVPSPDAEWIFDGLKSFNIQVDCIDFETFFEDLSRTSPSQKEAFANSFAACPGGTFRSARVTRYLDHIGIKLSDSRGKSGFTIQNLSQLMENGSIDDNGLVIPERFTNPIKTLFLPLDLENECKDEIVVGLFCGILKLKQRYPDKPVNLRIVIINGDEDDSRKYFRQHYEENLGNAPEQGPNTI